jgi:hypothetical protein
MSSILRAAIGDPSDAGDVRDDETAVTGDARRPALQTADSRFRMAETAFRNPRSAFHILAHH